MALTKGFRRSIRGVSAFESTGSENGAVFGMPDDCNSSQQCSWAYKFVANKGPCWVAMEGGAKGKD